jgi:exodeoxyribonuclease VII small subunit
MTNDPMSFEKAFERLEQILETMNAGKTPLEDSLKLFEEAEKLIRTCTGKLNSAEQKIEMLIKSRSGEVVLDAEQSPRLETYTRTSEPGFAQARPAFQPAPAAAVYAAPPASRPVTREQTSRSEGFSPPQSNLFNQMDELPF